ncbi:hypothetical protein V6N13_034095 [Hibiscus sabdariffa]
MSKNFLNWLSCFCFFSLCGNGGGGLIGVSAGIKSSAWVDSGSFGPELHQYNFLSIESAASCKLFHQPRLIIPGGKS